MAADDMIEVTFCIIAREMARHGVDKSIAVEELTQIADAYGPVRLLGTDRVEEIITAAFGGTS
jgi:hypothetical protein